MLCTRDVGWRGRRIFRHHGAVPQGRPGAVDDRLPQVGQGLLGVAQPAPAAVHRDERVLDDLLGGADVADQHGGEAHQTGVVRAIQLNDRLVSGGRLELPQQGSAPRAAQECGGHTDTTRIRMGRFTGEVYRMAGLRRAGTMRRVTSPRTESRREQAPPADPCEPNRVRRSPSRRRLRPDADPHRRARRAFDGQPARIPRRAAAHHRARLRQRHPRPRQRDHHHRRRRPRTRSSRGCSKS